MVKRDGVIRKNDFFNGKEGRVGFRKKTSLMVKRDGVIRKNHPN